MTTRNLSYKQNLYRLQLWDTAGQEKYLSIVPNYIRSAHCVVFVYDVTQEKTIEALNHWHNLFKTYQPEGSIAIVVGNKIDKKQEDRKVTREKGQKWARERSMAFGQVSAKSGQGIQELFQSILQNILIVGQNKGRKERDGHENSTKEYTGANTERSKVGKREDLNSCEEWSKWEKVRRLNKRQIVEIKERKKEFACCYI